MNPFRALTTQTKSSVHKTRAGGRLLSKLFNILFNKILEGMAVSNTSLERINPLFGYLPRALDLNAAKLSSTSSRAVALLSSGIMLSRSCFVDF